MERDKDMNLDQARMVRISLEKMERLGIERDRMHYLRKKFHGTTDIDKLYKEMTVDELIIVGY